MKNNFLKSFAMLVVIGLLASCSRTSSKTESTGADSTKTENTEKSTHNGKYMIKSGIVYYTVETMGMKQDVTVYFDDYGKIESTETIGEINMGIKLKIHTLSFMKDGYQYSLDMIKKTGTKIKVNIEALKNKDIDFTSLTEEFMKEMHLKKEGSETFLNRTCEKYTIDNAAMNMKGSYSIWKGITLKSDMSVAGMGVKMIANKIDENISIPAEKFKIPADIKITEAKL